MLIKHGADVHAKDKGGLVPLHNACSYGHYEVAELLVKVSKKCYGPMADAQSGGGPIFKGIVYCYTPAEHSDDANGT